MAQHFDVLSVARILGGARALGSRIRTMRELRDAVEEGLPVAALDETVRYVGGGRVAEAELKYRVVPKTTLHRRDRLTSDQSQRLERMARMIALAEHVWEDPALAREFLTSPQPQLDGERPLHLARSDLGTRQVEELLLRLEYALPA